MILQGGMLELVEQPRQGCRVAFLLSIQSSKVSS